MRNQPIGVLDSGIGGLSVLQEIKKKMPNESIVYFADSDNCPYGEKTTKEIRDITKKVVDFLVEKQCKIIVIACNSVTSVLIKELRKCYDLPFVGIEPAVLVAARKTQSKIIGVLATQATLESELFKKTKEKVSSNIKIKIKIGKGLVELVEKGEICGKCVEKVIADNLVDFKKKNVDQVVLGCTHYPFLLDAMRKVEPDLNFIDPAEAVARRVQMCLNEEKIESKAKKAGFCEIYVSKRVTGLKILIEKKKLFYINKIKLVEI